MEPFIYSARAAEVMFGRGLAAANVKRWIEERDFARVFVVSGSSQVRATEQLTSSLPRRVAGRFSAVAEHVPAQTAAAARKDAEAAGADLILSIGGGSATGTAKAIALTTGIPILAVPTTLAGSEMTDVWGITTDGRKETGVNPSVLPRAVVYDSTLLDSLPRALTVTSGFNALAHCVEAFWTPRSNPVTATLAREGIQQLSGGLRLLDTDPGEALDTLQYGSFLAGTVFSQAGSGLHHKICHALGGAFDLPHAGTHTVILPHVLRFNETSLPSMAAAVSTAMGTDGAAQGVDELVRVTGAPRTLRELGMHRDDLSHAVQVVSEKLPIPNPRPVSRDDIRALLSAAFGEGE